ncbi:MAG TPA: hypothetical protein VFV68_11450 [Agriterribacter sp.]|nr:hypothetical protein [Agriterribacter sp.]
MKKKLSFLVVAISLLSSPVFSQAKEDQTDLLGLPGDNLDLYAVLTLFQNSKTVEGFEKSLNDEQTKINNLDLNLDKKVDFIKVETKQKDKDFTFILQVDVTEKEKQDVAVILVSKDKNGKVTMQIVGDEALYGKNYVVEPKPASTPNPGYTGTQPAAAPATTVIVVESAPIVQYVYSPVYVPYYPPYYYAYYPPYYTAFTVMAVSTYHYNSYYYHAGYHGGYGNTTVIVNNTNNYNNYNKSRNTSNTVNHNNVNGNYGGANKASTNNNASTNNLSNNKASANSKASTSNLSSSNKPATTSSKSGGGRSVSGSGRSAGGGRRR